MELYFRYNEGALVSDGDSLSSAQEKPTGRRRDYVPSSDPGSRLPHMSIQVLPHLSEVCHLLLHKNHLKMCFRTFVTAPISFMQFYFASQTSSSFSQVSTLDLVSANEVEFLLIIAPIKESYQLAQAAFKVAEEFNVPLRVCIMWQEKPSDAIGSSKAALSPWENFVDVVEAKRSPSSRSWWDLCQMTERGAILVRPDEHIAWRAKFEIKNDPSLELKKAFSAILRLDSSFT